jgi:hypothetical protein
MKTLIPLTAVAAIALGLGACSPPKDAYGHWGRQAKLMKAVSRLDCPAERGELRRESVAPDGHSCLYKGDDDSTVELRLVSGDSKATLAAIEADSHALVPVTPDPVTPPAAPDTPDKAATGPTDVSMHPAGGRLPSGRSNDDVQIDLPGLHIHANDDKAKVRVAGIHVDADDRNDKVHVDGKAMGGFTVDAHEGGAIIRLDQSDANIRTRVQFASDTPGPQGDHSAGYVARGPRSGPLVVAIVRVKSDEGSHDDVFSNATSLVKHNVDD